MLIAIEIDKKWKWIATDEDGSQWFYTNKPTHDHTEWDNPDGNMKGAGTNPEAAKDWKNSLKRLEEIEMVD